MSCEDGPRTVKDGPCRVETAHVETAHVKTGRVKTARVKTARVKTARVKTARVKTGLVVGEREADDAPHSTMHSPHTASIHTFAPVGLGSATRWCFTDRCFTLHTGASTQFTLYRVLVGGLGAAGASACVDSADP